MLSPGLLAEIFGVYDPKIMYDKLYMTNLRSKKRGQST